MAIPKTLADIDTELTALHWRWLHACWVGDEPEVQLADAEQDVLLEERFKLTRQLALYGS